MMEELIGGRINMNINDIQSQPCIFTDAKTNYALCFPNGVIFQCYQKLADAQFMQKSFDDYRIYEVATIKGKIRTVLGEVL